MIRVLAIGNSFSQDATHYLHQIAAADRTDMEVVNLYIGGCSLERHWRNIVTGAADYLYELNGHSQERYVSVQEALAEEAWDVIVTQQASHDSGWPDSYEPFLGNMAAYVRGQCPAARLLMQKTWAYEPDSTHDCFARYHNSQKEMFDRLNSAYQKASERVGIPLIPCGDVIQALRCEKPFQYGTGGLSLCRDGFHMSYVYGRYAVAAAWYGTITGRKLAGNSYVPQTSMTEEKATENLLKLIQNTVDEIVGKRRVQETKPELLQT